MSTDREERNRDVDDADDDRARSDDAEVRYAVEGDGSREVVVSLRTYKAVTVFSTLVAIVCVVLGFAFLDTATSGVGPLSVALGLLPLPSLPVADGVFALAAGFVGIAFIALGAGSYVLGTRFRTAGMRNAQDDSAEPSDHE